MFRNRYYWQDDHPRKKWYSKPTPPLSCEALYLVLSFPYLQNLDLVLARSPQKKWYSKPTAPLSCEAPWGGPTVGGMSPCCSIDTSLYTQVVPKDEKTHLKSENYTLRSKSMCIFHIFSKYIILVLLFLH